MFYHIMPEASLRLLCQDPRQSVLRPNGDEGQQVVFVRSSGKGKQEGNRRPTIRTSSCSYGVS